METRVHHFSRRFLHRLYHLFNPESSYNTVGMYYKPMWFMANSLGEDMMIGNKHTRVHALSDELVKFEWCIMIQLSVFWRKCAIKNITSRTNWRLLKEFLPIVLETAYRFPNSLPVIVAFILIQE